MREEAKKHQVIFISIFASWYVRHSGGWIGHAIPVRQLIYTSNSHKREFNAFSPVSHTRFGFVLKVVPYCLMFMYVRGGGGTKAQNMFTK